MGDEELLELFAAALVMGRSGELRHSDRPDMMRRRGADIYHVARDLRDGFLDAKEDYEDAGESDRSGPAAVVSVD